MKIKEPSPSGSQNAPPHDDQAFPSARYFQIHFQYLQEIIGDLRVQVDNANRQIAELHAQLHPAQPVFAPVQDDYATEPESSFERRARKNRRYRQHEPNL